MDDQHAVTDEQSVAIEGARRRQGIWPGTMNRHSQPYASAVDSNAMVALEA